MLRRSSSCLSLFGQEIIDLQDRFVRHCTVPDGPSRCTFGNPTMPITLPVFRMSSNGTNKDTTTFVCIPLKNWTATLDCVMLVVWDARYWMLLGKL